MADLEEEWGRLYLDRSQARRRKMLLQSRPLINVTSEQYEKVEQELKECQEQEVAARWRRDMLEWGRQGGSELETGEEVLEQGQFPLDGGLADILTCCRCRHTFSKGWNKARHR